MFGFLMADLGHLTEEENLRYRSAYCGLCRSIRKRYGQLSGVILSYDLCFLVLLLQSLYEAEERKGENTCPRHPFKQKAWWQCCYTDYAADMSIALSYLKMQDDWQDDGSIVSWGAAAALKNAYREVFRRYPRQCKAIEEAVEDLHHLEKEKKEDPDAAARTCSVFMAEIFAYREDRWTECLRRFGASLGLFLYTVDAMTDLNRDSLRGSYNPYRRYYGCSNNEEHFRAILKMILGECLFWFDKLPLVTDAGILKNILTYGLWTEFDKKYVKSSKAKNGNE